MQSLDSYLPEEEGAMPVRLGSVEEGIGAVALTERAGVPRPIRRPVPEASVLTISADGVTVVGKGKWGMLYGVQTVNQLIRGTETVAGRLENEHESCPA